MIDIDDPIPFPQQRNHSLFGSVWSSMRRKGQAPFTRRAVSAKIAARSNNNLEKKYSRNDVDGDGDFLYNSMHQVVTDGMNHITQTIMHRRGGPGGDEQFMTGEDGDLINQDGELQTRGREDIPLQPLSMNNGAKGGPNGRGFTAQQNPFSNR